MQYHYSATGSPSDEVLELDVIQSAVNSAEDDRERETGTDDRERETKDQQSPSSGTKPTKAPVSFNDQLQMLEAPVSFSDQVDEQMLQEVLDTRPSMRLGRSMSMKRNRANSVSIKHSMANSASSSRANSAFTRSSK